MQREQFRANSFENNHGLQGKAKPQAMTGTFGNISATDENDFLLAQWYIRHS